MKICNDKIGSNAYAACILPENEFAREKRQVWNAGVH